MPDPSPPAGSASSRRRPAPAWLRLASVCVVLVVVPVALYLFLYQRSRVEEATIRNFRALAAVADRVGEVLFRLPQVVDGSSFGVSPTMFDQVTELLTGKPPGTGCGGDRGAAPAEWKWPREFPHHLQRSRRTTDAQRLEFRYRLAAHRLYESNRMDHGATRALWDHLHCLIDTHRKFTEPGETLAVQFNPMPRTALRPGGPECARGLATARCIRLRDLLEAAPCAESAPSPRLRAGRDGMQATVADCRRLEERSRELHEALKSFQGWKGVTRAVDFFGIRSTADLDELMNEATGYLSRYFDSHLIADADGLILFEAEPATVSEIEVDETRVETPGFSRYVDISELLRDEFAATDGGATGGAAAPAAPGASFHGRSFVRVVDVEDIRLRVFVQPFILDGVAIAGGSQAGAEAGAVSSRGGAPADAAAARAVRPTFYLVGVVDDREFRSAAIRLRLRMVTDATLVLLALLTLAPLLWFWTAGDRAVVGRFALLGVCVFPLVGVVLSTVVVCGVIAHRLDEHALDGAMTRVSDRIAELFDRELSDEIDRLQRAVPRLLARDRRERPSLPSSRKPRLRGTPGSDDRTLTRLETALYCDDADRDLDYDPARPETWSASLLNAEGRQRVCLSEPGRARPARTPVLDLGFRAYFEQPKQGVLWRSPPTARRRRPMGCLVGDMQDEESLIPCLVDSLPEPSKRFFDMPGAAGGAEAPYFLERIDSVIGGRLATVLAVHTGLAATPVATAGVSLNALDRAVPPRHMDFAVVNRETGRTLFHSDDDLAMTTYFVEDAGRDPALRSLLRSGARDIIELDYAGVPIRAHVRPLRQGLPWALVVYRGHELVDRLGGLTAALAIFFTLVGLFVAALATGLVLLAARWFRPPGASPGLPAVIGRVIAVASGLRGVAVPAALAALLIGFAGFSRLASIQPAGWRVLPFFAVCSVASVAVLVAGCGLVQRGSTRAADGGADHTTRRVFGLAVLIAAVAVLPSALWFGYHRSALGVGLNHYLMDATLEAVDRAREDYRRDSLQAHGAGAGVAPAGDRALSRWREEPDPDPGWVHRALRPIVATSVLANQLMTYRARPPADAGGASSLRDVFAATFRYPVGSPGAVLPTGDFGRVLALAMGLLLFAALLAVHAYSVCAACTVVGRRRYGLARLPSAGVLMDSKQGRPTGRPLRAIVVHRGGRGWCDFVYDLAVHTGLSPRDLRAEPTSSRPGYDDPSGREADAAKDETLWFVEDMEEDTLERGAEGRALFDRLERRVKGGQHVLIRSRVVPDYDCSDRLARAGRRFGGRGDDDALPDWRSSLAREFHILDQRLDHADDTDRHDRWSKLVREFPVFVLDGADAPEPRRDGLAGTTHPVNETMQEEADANPDLRHVAPRVSAEVLASVADGAVRDREAGALAVARFAKAEASGFRRLWTESTHDEQLQLYALARGGVVCSRRTAALSSLVNRGIVREDLETGVVELRSEAFRQFIEHDVDRGELDAWRKQGDGGAWRFVWPPLVIGGVLGLAFLAMANPEMRATLLTTLLGLLPAALPLLGARSGGSSGSAGGTGA